MSSNAVITLETVRRRTESWHPWAGEFLSCHGSSLIRHCDAYDPSLGINPSQTKGSRRKKRKEIAIQLISTTVNICLFILVATGSTGCKPLSDATTHELKELSADFYDVATAIKASLNDKELIITFDDGPISSPDACAKAAMDRQPLIKTKYVVPNFADATPGTSDLIDYLNYYQVPATFFVLTSEFYNHHGNACTIQRIIHSPHLIVANHTWTHTSASFAPKTCDNTSDIPLTPVYRPLPAHWQRLFPPAILRQYLKTQLVKANRSKEASPQENSEDPQSYKATPLTSAHLIQEPTGTIFEYGPKGWSIFPAVGQPPQHAVFKGTPSTASSSSLASPPAPPAVTTAPTPSPTSPAALTPSHPQGASTEQPTHPTPGTTTTPSPYPGYSKFITNEVLAAGCYLNQYILLYSHTDNIARDYPLFYRPPGGFWNTEDHVLLDHPELQAHIGPLAWHYGGQFDGSDVSDHECWSIAAAWESANFSQRQKLLAMAPPEYVKELKKGNVLKGCADAYIARIEKEPEGERKGIVLLHDNQPQTIQMFIEYLHPQLMEKGYKIVNLNEVPYIEKRLEAMRANPKHHKKLGSCVPPKDRWCRPSEH